MEISITSPPLSSRIPRNSLQNPQLIPTSTRRVQSLTSFPAIQSTFRPNSFPIRASSINDLLRSKSNLESLFCYDKSVPEENIEKPIGVSLSKKSIGEKPACRNCEAKGAVLCATCNGSGLYVDSILESQGIIVKVRCLGCGGTGNIMCSKCGGRGHTSTD
ncbi:hypothetical protein LUZ60_005394 [Juncus effusus]|nr:hypothetical protein LUZ60_005394 [Juncus effusus]